MELEGGGKEELRRWRGTKEMWREGERKEEIVGGRFVVKEELEGRGKEWKAGMRKGGER